MQYKGYRLVVTYNINTFYELDENGEQGKQLDVNEVRDESIHNDFWYSVVGEDGWVEQSFETIDECKEYIDQETDVPEMELKVPYIKPNSAKSEKEVG